MMESKTKELVKAGHELVVLLGTQHGMHDAASLVQRLTAQLDITAIVLREMTKKRDAEHGDVLTWEKTMFKVCGEDGPKSVADKFAALQAERDALAAENATLTTFIDNDCWVIDPDRDSYIDAAQCLPDTSATDAFLREQMAKGVEWNEGNTPDQFGRYWVRYETDVGPQYCSAQWMEYNFCAGSNNIHKIWLADHSRSIHSLKGVTHYARLPRPLESAKLRAGEDL